MNFIYGKLANTLKDLNNIKEITLNKCEEAGKPLDTLCVGDYYLKVIIYDTNRISYCDLSQFNDDHTFILNQLQDAIDENLTRFTEEQKRVNKEFNRVDTRIDNVLIKLKDNVDNILNKIDNTNKELAFEAEERKKADNLLAKNLDKESARVDSMINQLNTNISEIVTQLNNNIVEAINIINGAIEAERKYRADADTTLNTKIDAESEKLQNSLTTLSAYIDKNVNDMTVLVNTETTNRIQADEFLQNNIDNEALERLTQDKHLQDQLDDLSENTDSVAEELLNKINAETDRAIAAEDALNKDLQAETSNRIAADNDLVRRIGNLEGKTTRLYYGEGTLTSPTATEIQTFIDDLEVNPKYTAPYSGIAVVVYLTDEGTYHVWHYYENLATWKDDGVDIVSDFTNSSAGIIQGTLSVGYISAIDGFGKVNGWEELNSTILSNYSTLNSKIDQEIQDRKDDVNAEEQRATQAEQTLSTTLNKRIDDLENSTSTSTDALDKKIDAETARATAAETVLQQNIDDVNQDLQDKYNYATETVTKTFEEVNDRITNEVNSLESADSQITANLNAEIQARKDADNQISANLTKEQEQREAADQNIVNTELRFTKSTGTTVTVGGITKGTTFNNKKVLELLNDMLYPYVAFSISGFTLSPNGGTYEHGSTVSVTNTTTTVALGSEAITSVEILDGGSILASKTSEFTGNSFAIPISLTVSANKSLTTRVKDDRTTLTRGSASFTFVYPYYYGSLDAGVLDENSIKNLTKIVQQKGNKTFRFTHSNKCCVIAYPASYGDLRTIIDQNNFDITSSFTKNTVSITGLDGTAQNYNVYVNGAATLDNFGITFNY